MIATHAPSPVGPALPAVVDVEISVPVYNEAADLEASIHRLVGYLSTGFPFTWSVCIVDNASTDGTWAIAERLAATVPGVRALHLDRKGRGLALREAWQHSTAKVVAYMDVDLSTGLDALSPLVAPLLSGHSDLAIGSRLAPGASVARGPKREVISRTYNALLHVAFANRFRDAQCGFKAVRTDVARRLLPEVVDNAWFFDTELLLLAERNGLRIAEVPVTWVDDPDTRVDLAPTIRDDLWGIWRLMRTFARGGGRVDLGDLERHGVSDDLGRQVVSFAIVGVISTLTSLLLFVGLRTWMDAGPANAVAVGATAFANAWANRRYTFRPRSTRRRTLYYLAATALFVVGLAFTSWVAASAAGGSLAVEIVALVASWSLVTAVRFVTLRRWSLR